MAYVGKTIDQKLHLNSNNESFKKAKDLRKDQTIAESILWSFIRNKGCNGLKFRRQHPILSFIADFYCYEKKLVVEVDGSVHDTSEAKERDEARTHELENVGITVLRFSNEEILTKIDEVLSEISAKAEEIR